MRKLITSAIIAGLAPFAFAFGGDPSGGMGGGNSATATATACVNIYMPVSICTVQNLDFGYVVLTDPSRPATIDMRAHNGSGGGIGTGTMSYSNCGALASGSGAHGQHGAHEAVFDFTWDKRICDVGLTVPSEIRLNGPRGQHTMIHTNDTTSSSESGYPSGNHGSTQTHSFAVGGRVTIPGGDGTQAGCWKGTFSCVVNYL